MEPLVRTIVAVRRHLLLVVIRQVVVEALVQVAVILVVEVRPVQVPAEADLAGAAEDN